MSKGQKRSSKEVRKPAAEKATKSGPKYLQQGDTIQANRLGAQRPK